MFQIEIEAKHAENEKIEKISVHLVRTKREAESGKQGAERSEAGEGKQLFRIQLGLPFVLPLARARIHSRAGEVTATVRATDFSASHFGQEQ